MSQQEENYKDRLRTLTSHELMKLMNSRLKTVELIREVLWERDK